MSRLATDHGLPCPRFVAFCAFFLSLFILFCHFGDNLTIFTLLSLLKTLLYVVLVYDDNIATLAKTSKDHRGEFQFGLVI